MPETREEAQKKEQESAIRSVINEEFNKLMGAEHEDHLRDQRRQEDNLRDHNEHIQKQLSSLRCELAGRADETPAGADGQTTATQVLAMASPTLTMHPPVKFSGSMHSSVTVRQFLRDYNLYVKTAFNNNTARAKQFLYPNLEGIAADWYHSTILPIEANSTWKAIEDKFIERFGNSHGEQALMDKIYHREQDKKESVAAYAENMHSLMAHTNMAEGNKILFFIKGLRPGIKRLTTGKSPKTGKVPETFQQAIEAAVDAETLISAASSEDDLKTQILELLKANNASSATAAATPVPTPAPTVSSPPHQHVAALHTPTHFPPPPASPHMPPPGMYHAIPPPPQGNPPFFSPHEAAPQPAAHYANEYEYAVHPEAPPPPHYDLAAYESYTSQYG